LPVLQLCVFLKDRVILCCEINVMFAGRISLARSEKGCAAKTRQIWKACLISQWEGSITQRGGGIASYELADFTVLVKW